MHVIWNAHTAFFLGGAESKWWRTKDNLSFVTIIWQHVSCFTTYNCPPRKNTACANIKHSRYFQYQVSLFCPTMEKCSMCISDYMQATFFYLGKFLKKLADDQCSSISKSSIYYIKHRHIQSFSMGVDLPEIGCLMEVSTMFYICTYCVFTWWGRGLEKCITAIPLWHAWHFYKNHTLNASPM